MSNYDFKLLRDDIISRAFRIVGVIGVDDVLTAGQLKQGVEILNALVLALQSRGTFLWTWTSFNLNLEDGVSGYALPQDPPILFVESGRVNFSNSSSEVFPVSYLEYLKIIDTSEVGIPSVFSSDGVNLLLWPTPNEQCISFTAVAVRRGIDWDVSNTDGGFPPQWGNALVYAVAADLANEYGVPIRERQQLRFEAETMYRLASRGEKSRTNTSFVRSAYLI